MYPRLTSRRRREGHLILLVRVHAVPIAEHPSGTCDGQISRASDDDRGRAAAPGTNESTTHKLISFPLKPFLPSKSCSTVSRPRRTRLPIRLPHRPQLSRRISPAYPIPIPDDPLSSATPLHHRAPAHHTSKLSNSGAKLQNTDHQHSKPQNLHCQRPHHSTAVKKYCYHTRYQKYIHLSERPPGIALQRRVFLKAHCISKFTSFAPRVALKTLTTTTTPKIDCSIETQSAYSTA